MSAPRMGAMRDDQKIAEARPSLRPDTKAAPTIISSWCVLGKKFEGQIETRRTCAFGVNDVQKSARHARHRPTVFICLENGHTICAMLRPNLGMRPNRHACDWQRLRFSGSASREPPCGEPALPCKKLQRRSSQTASLRRRLACWPRSSEQLARACRR